jgi:hypothetical protein
MSLKAAILAAFVSSIHPYNDRRKFKRLCLSLALKEL